MQINEEIGKKIRSIRKYKGLSAQDLATLIFKSKATVSKYEHGSITLDVETLYAIAKALNVQVEQLLYAEPHTPAPLTPSLPASFFRNSTRFYSYFYDGRINKLVRCVVDMMAETEGGGYKTLLYMNVKDFEHYLQCENSYSGYTVHYDTLTTLILTNQATPLEKLTIHILASFLESEQKWGLMSGVSFRPFMPIALKMLFSKTPLDETKELINELKISKDDIRKMKLYNMLSVT